MSHENRKSDRIQSVDAKKYDENMKVGEVRSDALEWRSPLEAPFQIAGFPWLNKEEVYRRLPLRPADPLPEAVDMLANCTAGGQIRFTTDSPKLSIRVRLSGPANMYHMPATGQCGFDCYIGMPGEQLYYSTASFDQTRREYESILYSGLSREQRNVTLNFPLYQGVEEVVVGLEPGSTVSAPPPYADGRKVVLYGTSITQGGCASRPGMAYPNILSRRIPLEFVNLGFSGSGKGEPQLARIIAEISDPACLVLDYEANSGDLETFSRTLPAFIRIYREKHPEVPILVVSKIPYAKEAILPDMARLHEERKRLQAETVEACRREGDRHIHFHDGSGLLGVNAQECTVDGIHPTDLGFLNMADGLEPVLRTLLGRLLPRIF